MTEPIPVPPRPTFPGLLQGLLLLVLVWASLIFVATGAMVVYALRGLSLEEISTAPLLILSNGVGFLMVLVLGTWMARAPLRSIFPFRRFNPGVLAPLALVSVGGYLMLGEADVLFRGLPSPDWFAEFMEEVDRTTLDMIRQAFWPAAFALMVVAPLTEELFFRGLLLRGFLARYGRARALWASALFFAAAHLTPNQFLPALLIGLFMAWLMAESRNLWLPILVHVLINGISILSVGLLMRAGSEPEPPTHLPWWAVLAAVAGLVGGFFWLRRLLSAPRARV